MVNPIQIEPGLWVFPIVLPENPLKWLNCYVISGERNLLIDTGFNRLECLDALLAGMDSLRLKPENTDVFLTHFHSDHIGGASTLEKLGYHLIMGKTDYDYFCVDPMQRLRRVLRCMRLGGMPEDTLQRIYAERGPSRFAPAFFHAETVESGDVLRYGEYTLRCVEMPGHTPGHICLWSAEKKTLFLGDHVLFDITPNICVWPEGGDALGEYLNSLERVTQYEARLALPAHRNRAEISLVDRVEQLRRHHAARLDEVRALIRQQPGIDAFHIARQMSWKIHAKSWEEFPIGQQYFAMNEALAHLKHLELLGEIWRESKADGNAAFWVSEG